MMIDLESKANGKQAFSREDAARVLASPDLVGVGVLGEAARQAHHGDTVTFCQVLVLEDGHVSEVGEAQEVRLTGEPASVEEAAAWVAHVATIVGGIPITGFSVEQLLALAGGDHLRLMESARQLQEAGLAAVASLSIDRVEDAAELVRAVRHGGLLVPRVTIHQAPSLEQRLRWIEQVAALQADVGGLHAFAPLPVVDQPDVPSTGYDDVRTIAVARLVCASVPSIQVDWPTYGPKLAQVALTYGADDIDRVPAISPAALGQRRSPRAEIERQIAAAFATPAARNGRFERI